MIIPLLLIKTQAQRGRTACPKTFSLSDCKDDVPSAALHCTYKVFIPLFWSLHVLYYLPTVLREKYQSLTSVHQRKQNFTVAFQRPSLELQYDPKTWLEGLEFKQIRRIQGRSTGQLPMTHWLILPHKVGMNLLCIRGPNLAQCPSLPPLYLLREDLDLRSQEFDRGILKTNSNAMKSTHLK